MIDVGILIEDEVARRGIKLIGRGPERCGPCPACGGTDRFSINTKKQVFNCRGFGGGDVIALVQHLDGCDFKTAIRTLGAEERPVIRPALPPSPPERTGDDNSKRALELWQAAVPIGGTLAMAYLANRGLGYTDVNGEVLRFHPRCPFGPGMTYPCMVALFRAISSDKPVAIHRTALAPDGRKLDRRSLGAIGGAAIKLTAADEVTYGLSIGEGVETTLAAMALGFRPAWVLGSAGAIRAFPILAGIDCLTILVDHDNPDRNGRQAGHEAARECAERWMGAGREVRSVVPRRRGADMADLFAEVPA